jgi:hypothetical protein
LTSCASDDILPTLGTIRFWCEHWNRGASFEEGERSGIFMKALTVASLKRALAKLPPGCAITPKYLYLRNSLTTATIESVKPVKVSGLISPQEHTKLLLLADLCHTTVGILVSTAVRRTLEKPREVGGLKIDGRSAKAKALKRKSA